LERGINSGLRIGTRLQKKYFTSKDQLVGISSDVVEAFAKEKLLGPDFTFNHASALTDFAWRLVRETGCRVNVCTRSDAQYGLGSGSSATRPPC
jgi:cytosine/adenosine deaminase-related metal-dependent hydrolase